MLSGWQDVELSSGNEATYYFGDENEGWAATGWQYLEIPEEDYESDGSPEDSEGWYYFGTNGRAVKNQNKYINGFYYTFDENGVMDDTWVVGTARGFRRYSPDCHRCGSILYRRYRIPQKRMDLYLRSG